ncbi:MAG: imelysin family protein [Pseudomonadota bacterium]
MLHCSESIKRKPSWPLTVLAGSRPARTLGVAATAALLLGACADEAPPATAVESDEPEVLSLSVERAGAVVDTYADLAHATYEDSLLTARALSEAIEALVDAPAQSTLDAARNAWLAARVPYQQTETFRFGNPLVDDWEGRVNAWPLDEGLIDYVDASYGQQSDANPAYAVNVIANAQPSVNGEPVDASAINGELLREVLHEAGAVEANVATGYHAIEFLLWGQDLNGTGPGAGQRPASDFAQAAADCTGGHCERRVAYLRTAAQLLIDDLETMVALWEDGGAARTNLTDDPVTGVNAMISGMGSLSYGELAGERMRLGLVLHDPEEEHDCFSDNTHNSHYYNQVGIENVYRGRYRRVDGSTVSGPSLAGLAQEADPALAAQLEEAVLAATQALTALKARGDDIEAFDQMIAEGNADGQRAIEQGVDALIAQTRPLEQLVTALGLGSVYIEGSDALDDPAAIFQ